MSNTSNDERKKEFGDSSPLCLGIKYVMFSWKILQSFILWASKNLFLLLNSFSRKTHRIVGKQEK